MTTLTRAERYANTELVTKGYLEEVLDEREGSLLVFLGERFDRIDAQFKKIDERFEKIDERFEKIDTQFEVVHRRLDDLAVIKVSQEKHEVLARRVGKVEQHLGLSA